MIESKTANAPELSLDGFRAAYENKVYANAGNAPLLAMIPMGTKTVLDIGCGAGDNARILKSMGIAVTGVTLSNAEATCASDFCERVIVANAETELLPFPTGSFDVLLLSHVLEHTIHPDRVLTKLASFLRDGGTALVAVPNPAQYRYRFRLAFGNWRMTETGPFDRTHLHFWSYWTVDEVVEGTPFEIIQKRPGDPAFPLWPFRRILPKALLQRFDMRAGKTFPNFCSAQTLLELKLTVTNREPMIQHENPK